MVIHSHSTGTNLAGVAQGEIPQPPWAHALLSMGFPSALVGPLSSTPAVLTSPDYILEKGYKIMTML